MLFLQRQNVISSGTSDALDTDYGEVLQDLTHKSPNVRVFALGRIATALNQFSREGHTLSSLDKRLIKGFFVRDLGELEESELKSETPELTFKPRKFINLNKKKKSDSPRKLLQQSDLDVQL